MSLLIDRICIRARDDNGKWGSFTLAELSKMNRGATAFEWLIERLTGLQWGEEILPEHLEKLAQLLPKDSYVALKDDHEA